jgi:hypothetical protein
MQSKDTLASGPSKLLLKEFDCANYATHIMAVQDTRPLAHDASDISHLRSINLGKQQEMKDVRNKEIS